MYASLRNYNFEFIRVHIQTILLQCAKQIFLLRFSWGLPGGYLGFLNLLFPMGFVFYFKQISRN